MNQLRLNLLYIRLPKLFHFAVGIEEKHKATIGLNFKLDPDKVCVAYA